LLSSVIPKIEEGFPLITSKNIKDGNIDFEDVNSRINIIRKLMIIYSERIPHLTEDDINELIFGE
jgi:hypothetical protein